MNWYVLHTKPRNEKKVEEQLLSIGINAYCPKRTEIKFWSDLKKKGRSSNITINGVSRTKR